MPRKKYYTSREAAALLNVSIQTIKNRVTQGFFEPERNVNGRLLFTEKDLKKYGPLDFQALEAAQVKTTRKQRTS
jgi:predicted site-specific integrase-resolvase